MNALEKRYRAPIVVSVIAVVLRILFDQHPNLVDPVSYPSRPTYLACWRSANLHCLKTLGLVGEKLESGAFLSQMKSVAVLRLDLRQIALMWCQVFAPN
jgi:hypothetical protein